MAKLLGLRTVGVMALMFLAACAETPLGPTGLRESSLGAPSPALAIEGLPSGQRLAVGQNVLLSLLSLPEDVLSVRWTTTDAAVASLQPTAAISPCGQGCAWVSGSRPGAARIRATVFFSDGSHAEVASARVCLTPASGGCRFVPAELVVE